MSPPLADRGWSCGVGLKALLADLRVPMLDGGREARSAMGLGDGWRPVDGDIRLGVDRRVLGRTLALRDAESGVGLETSSLVCN